MKVCCIGDIHGTDKFLKCYDKIIKKDNDCDKIIVFGDHFDPYKNLHFHDMIDNYIKFTEIMNKDERVISLLGNHDLSSYIIQLDKTNRTLKWKTGAAQISRHIRNNLNKSYLCYRINDYLFSHAGVSETWFNNLKVIYQKRLIDNYTGWTDGELYNLVSFYPYDKSHWGDDPNQGCTWIRPESLINNPYGDYNQVVAHTRVDVYQKIKMSNDKDLWMVDTKGNPDYLTLNIEKSE